MVADNNGGHLIRVLNVRSVTRYFLKATVVKKAKKLRFNGKCLHFCPDAAVPSSGCMFLQEFNSLSNKTKTRAEISHQRLPIFDKTSFTKFQ